MKALYLFSISIVLGLTLAAASATAQESDTTRDLNASADLEKLNVTRTNDSNITRRLLSAVPGVDGRVIRQEPAKAVPGVEGGIVGQDTPSIITTEPPAQTEPAATTLLPEPVEKAACGPTALLALAMLPLILKRKNH